jgi:cell division protein FtsI (penicillin-binding protein 3)
MPVANPHRRVRLLLVAAVFVFTVFGAQLLRVQAFDASSVREAALDKRLATTVTPALRGQILDRNGVVLASSVERKTIYADQKVIPTYSRTVDGVRSTVGVVGAAQALAPLLQTTPEALVPQLMGTQYRIIAKDVTPLVWRQITKLGIPGLYSEPTTSRVYPAGMTSAPLVGFVQKDGTAGGGLEVMEDRALQGTPGKLVYQRAQDGTIIPGTETEDQVPANGQDVRLTIDADLQWYAQNSIANMVTQSQALSGYVVVQEVKTGKLRAVASYPTFDPTDVAKSTSETLANHAFQDVYEPGSTGKVMSVSAAIEEGLIQPTTQLIVPNRLPRSDTTFKDDVDHPTLNLTVAGALAMSSNIGTMIATEKVPPATMYDYFRKFGMGSKSGVGFPGESAGLLAKPEDWSGSQRYTLLFGQGYSLNAIQAAGVYQTLANGGVRIPPSLVESTTDANGKVALALQPQGTRVVSKDTATKVSQMLEEVVGPHGTGLKAKIDGYRVAGKTGTADRYDASVGGYSGFTASFIGYAPADDPQYVVAVTLQRPLQGHFGGQLGAPVFKDVMTYALQKASIPPTDSAAPAIPLNSADSAWDPNDPAVLGGEKKRTR